MAAGKSGCDQVRLGRYLEGDLDEAEQAELAFHLEDCERCREALDAMAGGDRWLGEVRAYLEGEAGSRHPAVDESGHALRPRFGSAEQDRRLILSYLDPPDDVRHLGRLATYQVQEVIGRGGMGVVLKAIDPALGRVVAIKVLAPELSYLSAARQRFAREARAAASVAHEHVVAIHAVDSWRDLPYLVMQYVPGRSLQERVDRDGPLGVREVLRIGMQVASGLAAAHAQGLVHRDVKPANILLENGVERVRISDFGLARAADDATVSQSGVVAGTPQYMAPEQARGEAIGPRSDLFSLGSVLYAMCCGHSPFRAETTMGVLRRVCDDTPRPLRALNPEVPGWLAAIIARLLAKDPVERFQTAAEVADLLGRCLVYLEHTPDATPPYPPTAACPVPVRASGQHVAALAMGCLLLTLGLGATEAVGVTSIRAFVASVLRIKTPDGTLVVTVDDPETKVRVDGEELVIAGSGPQEFRYRPGRHQVVATRRGTPVHDEMVTITRGGKQVVSITREDSKGGEGWEDAARSSPVPADERTPSRPRHWLEAVRPAPGTILETLRPVPPSCVDPIRPLAAGAISTAAYSADGTLLALGCAEGSVAICSVATNRLLGVYPSPGGRVWSLAFSPDGKTLGAAGGSWDREVGDGFVTLWDVESGQERSRPVASGDLVLAAGFSPDGSTFAWAGRDHMIHLWDVAGDRPRATGKGHEGTIRSIAFHPGGQRLVSAGFDGSIRFWDVATGREDGEPIRLAGKSSNCVAISPDGTTLAANTAARSDEPGWNDPSPGSVRLWDWNTRRERLTLSGHRYAVLGVAFSPDGTMLASAGGHLLNAAEVKVWDLPTGQERLRLEGHEAWVECVTFSPDSTRLVSAGGYEQARGEVRVWDLSSSGERPATR